MPTYEYECSGCHKKLEAFQSMSDAPLKKCPKCGKPRLRRLIGAGAGVIFKGSGFYTTDYRSSSYDSAKKSDSDSGTKKSDSDSKKSDSDSAAKSDSKTDTTVKPACATDGCQPAPPAKKSKPKK